MKKVLCLATSCLLMTGCVIDKREFVSAEEKYNEAFVSLFGNIDPEHTWAMVENKAVSVNLDAPSDVKIYTKVGRTYKLAANYKNVSGNKELSFDAPMGCEDVLVTVNGAPYQQDGSRAVLNENKIVWTEEVDEDDTNHGNIINNTYHYYTLEQLGVFHQNQPYLPEGGIDNINKINLDYVLVSDGEPYTFTPTFWNASYDHVYGIYYYEKDDKGRVRKKEIDFYQNKGDLDRKYADKEHQELQRLNPQTGEFENVTADCSFDGLFNKDGSFTDLYKGTEKTDFIMRSKHFHILLPEGTVFGFYVKAGGKKFYSDPSLNERAYRNHSAFGHIVIGDYTYIVVEDAPNGDNDYNDFVFTMAGAKHDHISEEPNTFIYATEDLGNTDDFDFNDVVFSVAYPIDEEKAHVTLMAAGGTLHAQIYFNDTPVGKEVHEAFGVDVKTMVNTNSIEHNFVDLGYVNVGSGWSHTSYSEIGNGFKVKIIKDGKEYNVGTPGASNGEAPQMLILEHNWFWPMERTRINVAYPNIGEWAGNYKSGTWVNEVSLEDVVQRSILNQNPTNN